MTKMEKLKRTVMIAIGFALATYLIISGMAILEQEELQESNSTSEVHSDTVK